MNTAAQPSERSSPWPRRAKARAAARSADREAPAGDSFTEEDLASGVHDPAWRLSNLYKIITKGSGGEDLVVTFRPNRAQRRLLRRLHNRNVILKARQLGFTTLIAILWLDSALFADFPMRCGIIAHEKDAAEAIFRDKVRFAYEQLPPELRDAMPVRKLNSTEIEFEHNGASVRVATSMRSGTMHRLLISEYGKICAKYPDRAREVMSGSIPTVPTSGIVVVESTAEGQEGRFYDMTKLAQAQADQGLTLSPVDYRFHFYPWWQDPHYTLENADRGSIILTPQDVEYFLKVEGITGRKLSDGQRRWYVATRRSTFLDDAPTMWQEYPSYPDEAFAISTEGCFLATQMAEVRRTGRIVASLPLALAPVYTFWDLGRSDMTAIWLMQRVGQLYHFIGYYENSGEEMDHYATWLQEQAFKRRLVYASAYLPHDAAHRRMGQSRDTNRTLEEMLNDLMPTMPTEIVTRVTYLQTGVQTMRRALAFSVFDEEHCQVGLRRLSNWRKRWDKVRGRWTDEEEPDDNCHGADAYRQFSQAWDSRETFGGGRAPVAHEDGRPMAPSGVNRSPWSAARRRRRVSAMGA